ncbi:MAG: hypothetical protein WC109_01600 [Syntrophomonadaceae bacterium]|nr:hypothetical protein [Syntrophomonadaceae bacterium]MDD3899357.1 hypothetical protein [Syntrophomonadaceae bacterium]
MLKLKNITKYYNDLDRLTIPQIIIITFLGILVFLAIYAGIPYTSISGHTHMEQK